MSTRYSRRFLLPMFLLAATFPGAPVLGAGLTLYVSPNGSDGNTCMQSLPCREIRRALALAGPGDMILVADGSYKGFNVDDLHGNASSPIVIKAQGTNAVIQKTTDRSDNRDTILIRFSSYIVVDGLRSSGANRAALRVSESQSVTVRNCVFGNNSTWGIFTDFSDDLLIENNETYGSVAQHGIYVSNSGDRSVVRGNRVHDNTGNGLHFNGDIWSGGDGIISGALIENNVIYNNGTGGGGGINMDGVQDSTIRNNILYNNHASGITLYQIDGAEGPKGNKVYHNTVHQASDGRYALLVWNTWGTNTVRNNILYHPNSARGGITYANNTDVNNTDSDYNVLDRITPDDSGTLYTLAQWQAQGHETHSFSASPTALFVNSAGGDYHLKSGSPAIDRAQTLAAVTKDFEGSARPLGGASDVGADEASGAPSPTPVLQVTPSSLSFGSVNVGSSANLTLTVKNVGGGTLTGSASTAAPFSVVGTASYSLAASQAALVTVRFSPTSAGAANGTLSLTGGGSASVSLSGTGAASSVGEAVVWTSASGVSVSGSSLTKTAPTGWNNAGAVSTKALASGDGYVEFTVTEANTRRTLGLSNGNSNLNWNDLDFGLYLNAKGRVRVYEKGVSRGTFGRYATGDKMRVAVVSGSVKYSRNGIVFYASSTAPTYPLLVDTSLYNKGATLTAVVISGTLK